MGSGGPDGTAAHVDASALEALGTLGTLLETILEDRRDLSIVGGFQSLTVKNLSRTVHCNSARIRLRFRPDLADFQDLRPPIKPIR